LVTKFCERRKWHEYMTREAILPHSLANQYWKPFYLLWRIKGNLGNWVPWAHISPLWRSFIKVFGICRAKDENIAPVRIFKYPLIEKINSFCFFVFYLRSGWLQTVHFRRLLYPLLFLTFEVGRFKLLVFQCFNPPSLFPLSKSCSLVLVVTVKSLLYPLGMLIWGKNPFETTGLKL